MLDRLLDHFLTQPRRLVESGRALMGLTGFVAVIGLVTRVATTAMSVVHGMSGASEPASRVADLLPGLPTWWVPETVFGYGLVLLFFGAGFVAVQTGQKYKRFLRH